MSVPFENQLPSPAPGAPLGGPLLWFLLADGTIVLGLTRKVTRNATHFCHEGDGSKGLFWRPIAELNGH